MILKNFDSFINENIDEEQIITLKCSSVFNYFLNPLKTDYKVARVLLQLSGGVQKKHLIENHANYLDISFSEDKPGYISYLKPKNFSELDKWNSTRRITQKATKALKEIYTEEFLNATLTNVDFELFFNKIASTISPAKILEFRGNEVLRAYNYTKELTTLFGNSCANFHQREMFPRSNFAEPSIDWYDVYIKNPENFGAAVVMENNQIVGRLSFVQGPSLITNANYKKGEIGTIMNNYYGVSGKYKTMLVDYLKDKYRALPMGNQAPFATQMETRFAHYPPFDSLLVCFKYNIITDNYNAINELIKEYKLPSSQLDFNDTYKASCPSILLKEKAKEEAEGKTYKKLLDTVIQ